MSNVSFSWFCPSHGPGSNGQSTVLSIEEVIRSGVIAEENGFSSILTPADSNCLDPWMVATFIIQATKRIKPIVALRTGFIEPTYAARMYSTLVHLSNGRIDLNIVSGGSPIEYAKEGCFLNHKERYSRTHEFMDIITNLTKNDFPYNFTGEFYKVKNALLYPPLKNENKGKIYIAGSSSEAQKIACQFGNAYLTWADSLSKIRDNIKLMANKSLLFGLRVNIIVRKNKTDAVEVAEEYLSKNSKSRRVLELISKQSDSVGQKIMIKNAVENKKVDNCLWTSFVAGKTGIVPTLVGSTQEVNDSIERYKELGISDFIFGSINHDVESDYVSSEILSKNV